MSEGHPKMDSSAPLMKRAPNAPDVADVGDFAAAAATDGNSFEDDNVLEIKEGRRDMTRWIYHSSAPVIFFLC